MSRTSALPRRAMIDVLLLGPGYFLLAALTITLTRFDGGVAFIWVATSVLLVRLTILPVSRWVVPLAACGTGNLIATALFGLGVAAAPLMTVANLLEAAIGAWLLQRSGVGARCFETLRGVTVFTIASGVVAPLCAGLPAAAAAWLAIGAPYGTNLLHWVAGHALGTLAFAPVAMLIARGDIARWRRRMTLREGIVAVAMLIAVAAVIAMTFWQARAPILFLPMLPMMAMTIVLGRFGAAASIVLLALIGGLLSLNGHGPVHLLAASPGMRVLFFQGYVACAGLLVLPVAALLRQHRELIDRLSESEAKYRVIAERTGDAVIDVAADGTIRYASPMLHDLTGRDPLALIGSNARALVDPEDRETFWATHRAAMDAIDRAHAIEYRADGFGGDRWHEVSMRAVTTAEGVPIGVIGSIRDVSERKAAERELTIQASTDPLTGLANRRAFHAMLDRAVARVAGGDRNISVALFDLDRFKAVNDSYGHAAGDAVLVAFADIARATLRSADCIGRIGGEEFAVLLSDLTPIEAAAAGDRLRRTLRAATIAINDGGTVAVTVSVGVATVLPGLDADAVLRAADSALYRAKASGRDCLRRAA